MNKIIKVNDDILDSKHKIDSSFNNKVAAVFSNNTYCKTIIGYMKLKERKRLMVLRSAFFSLVHVFASDLLNPSSASSRSEDWARFC
jgi:hypothetical protein